MSRPMYSRFSIVLSVALGCALVGGNRGTALAHAYPAVSIPNNGATVKEPPREVRIQFTEAVELAFSQITVKGAKGEVVSQGKLRQLANDTLAVDLLPLPPGITPSNGRYFPSIPILPTAHCASLQRLSRKVMIALEASRHRRSVTSRSRYFSANSSPPAFCCRKVNRRRYAARC